MEHWDTIAAERRRLADQLADLRPEQWTTASLCDAWAVRDVAAHLVAPNEPGTLARFLVALVAAGGSFERANVAFTARVARRPTTVLVADLRRCADRRFAPPGFGSIAPLTDVLVHGQDIRIPLGLGGGDAVGPWRSVLDFVVGRKARRGFVPRALPPLRLVATDTDWSHGSGEEARGPAVALALAVLGRPARAADLHGPGAARLTAWSAGGT